MNITYLLSLALALSIHNKLQKSMYRNSVGKEGCVRGLDIFKIQLFVLHNTDTHLISSLYLSLLSRYIVCRGQTPCPRHPPLVRYSTRPLSRTFTDDHTSKRTSVLREQLRMSGWQGQRQAVSGHSRRHTLHLEASDHSHRETTVLFLMTVREGTLTRR
jgi:hypothetical protein